MDRKDICKTETERLRLMFTKYEQSYLQFKYTIL